MPITPLKRASALCTLDAPRSPILALPLILTLILALTRQYDGPVNGIRQPAVASADHHGTDDKLAEGGELAAERCHDGWVA